MKEIKGIDEALNLFISKFKDNELWMQCDYCGEKITKNISDHECDKKHWREGELVDLVELYCKDTPKKG